LELRVQPGRERLRPYETAVIQLRGYGAATPRPVRSLDAAAAFRVLDAEGGWISKPFGPVGGDSSLRDAVLYTAPGRAGRYTVEARLGQRQAQAQIEVTHAAPSFRPGETTSFGAERGSRDFYRALAEHHAPLVCQETWFQPKADFLARFDYDGDWRGDNNWDNLPEGSSQAYVYYAATETATHYFLVYNFFYPRDYSDQCGPDACHENDSTGVILTVRKDGSRHGRVQAMETLAGDRAHSYTADSRIREGARALDGEVKLWRDSHPVVFVESGAHGVSSGADPQRSRFSVERMEFTASSGVLYRYGGAAGRPLHANDRDVTYELLAAAEHFWPRAASRDGGASRTFDEYFRYIPAGNRPPAAADELPGAFLGRKFLANKARPFWAWQDAPALRRRLLAAGQLGLDPAYSASVSLRFPSPFALDYIFNPYLETAGGRGPVTAAAGTAPRPAPQPAGGERIPLSPPSDKPKYKLEDRRGQLEFRGRADGSLYLHVHGDRIEVEYLSGRPMDEVRYRFSQPLPAVEMEEVRLEDIEGRGSVRLLEWPNAGNQFTAKVRIQDDKGGASTYKFKLVWRR